MIFTCSFLSFFFFFSRDGTVLAVGATGECSFSSGVGASTVQNCSLGVRTGAVYIYFRSPDGVWKFGQYIKASNAAANNQFGYVVSLSGDGRTLVVSAINERSLGRGVNPSDQTQSPNVTSGAVYVFSQGVNATQWSQTTFIKASNAMAARSGSFGSAAALSLDGRTLVVGDSAESGSSTGINGDQNTFTALMSGAAYVFQLDPSSLQWAQVAYFKASNSAPIILFGSSVSVDSDGSNILVGASYENGGSTGVDNSNIADSAQSGAAYLFSKSAQGVWSQAHYIKASNTADFAYFGGAAALSGDASTAAVSALGDSTNGTGVGASQQFPLTQIDSGAAYVYSRTIVVPVVPPVVIPSGSSVNLSGLVVIPSDVVVSVQGALSVTGTLSVSGQLNIASGGSLVVSGPLTVSGNISVSNSNQIQSQGQFVILSGSSLTVSTSAPGTVVVATFSSVSGSFSSVFAVSANSGDACNLPVNPPVSSYGSTSLTVTISFANKCTANNNSGLSVGAIAGIAVGAAVGVAIIGALIGIAVHRRNQRNLMNQVQSQLAKSKAITD